MAISVQKNWVTIAMKNLGCHVQSLSRIRKFMILSDKAALNVPWHQLHFQAAGDNLNVKNIILKWSTPMVKLTFLIRIWLSHATPQWNQQYKLYQEV